MAELADAPDLGSGGNPVQVQVLLSAGTPYRHKNRMFLLKHPIFVPFIEKS